MWHSIVGNVENSQQILVNSHRQSNRESLEVADLADVLTTEKRITNTSLFPEIVCPTCLSWDFNSGKNWPIQSLDATNIWFQQEICGNSFILY